MCQLTLVKLFTLLIKGRSLKKAYLKISRKILTDSLKDWWNGDKSLDSLFYYLCKASVENEIFSENWIEDMKINHKKLYKESLEISRDLMTGKFLLEVLIILILLTLVIEYVWKFI
jgi:hypothetical protein